METSEAINLEAIMNDIGISGPVRDATRRYAESIIESSIELPNQDIELMIGSFSDGYLAAIKG